MSRRPILLVVAPVGGALPAGVQNPLTPEAIAADTLAAARAGASMVHLHVRDARGALTEDTAVFARTLDLIRAESDIIVQGSTGGLSSLTLEQRCVALTDPRVEVASLNMGSVNFGEAVYVNTLPDIRYWAGRMSEAQVLPELELFEGGMIHNVALLAAEGCLRPPFVYGFALGFRGALPATARHMQALHSLLPPGAVWGLAQHDGDDFTLLATALGMGATAVRVGFEDSVYYAPGEMAHSNAELAERMARLIHDMGLRPASPSEARHMLGLKEKC
jgi:3-keto-5-aminohexanoate cleavage enzyme